MIQMIFPLCSEHTQWQLADRDNSLQRLLECSGRIPLSLLSSSNSQVAASLLLQAGVSYNSDGCFVVCIASKPWHQLPKLVHGMHSPDPVLMQRMRMLYMDQCDQLIAYFSDVHRQKQAIPDIIIIYDLDFYANQSQNDTRPHTMARLCALLADSAEFIANKSGRSSFHIIASLNDGDNVYKNVCPRFIKDIWTIKCCHSAGCDGNCVEYEIQRHDSVDSEFHCRSKDERQLAIQFSVGSDCLYLSHVIELTTS